MTASRRTFIKGVGATALLPLLPKAGWATTGDAKATTFHRVLCCNIRVALPEDEDKGVGWSSRKDICLKIIKQHKPDILCLQEVLKVQAADFRNYFPKFTLFGFDGPEMDANPTGYHGIAKNPILFSNDRYELMGGGTYWLSETPLVAGSKSWDTARARHANWVRLRERKTLKEFRVVNLHLDHVSEEAKMQQAKMVADESSQYLPGFPQILSGDFNSRSTSPVFNSIRTSGWSDTYAALYGDADPGYTTHEFEGEHYAKGKTKGRIDFIFGRGPVKSIASTIIKDSINGKYPSDHYFMSADVEFN